MEALLEDTLLLAGGGLVTQEQKWDRLLTDYPKDIIPFLWSSGIGGDSTGATSGLSHSWWFHSPLPCVHSPFQPGDSEPAEDT